MKPLLIVLGLSLTTSAFAARPPGTLRCGVLGNLDQISIQFAGPRYMDAIGIDLDDEALAALAQPGDIPADQHYGQLGGFAQMGTCHGAEGDVLASCSLKPGSAGFLHYSFNTSRMLGDDFSEGLQVSRTLLVQSFELEVRKEGDHTRATLDAVVDTAGKKNVRVHVSRRHGPLNGNWETCEYR